MFANRLDSPPVPRREERGVSKMARVPEGENFFPTHIYTVGTESKGSEVSGFQHGKPIRIAILGIIS